MYVILSPIFKLLLKVNQWIILEFRQKRLLIRGIHIKWRTHHYFLLCFYLLIFLAYLWRLMNLSWSLNFLLFSYCKARANTAWTIIFLIILFDIFSLSLGFYLLSQDYLLSTWIIFGICDLLIIDEVAYLCSIRPVELIN